MRDRTRIEAKRRLAARKIDISDKKSQLYSCEKAAAQLKVGLIEEVITAADAPGSGIPVRQRLVVVETSCFGEAVHGRSGTFQTGGVG
jgi:hypothetical protein